MDDLKPVAAAAAMMKGTAQDPARSGLAKSGPVILPANPEEWGFSHRLAFPVIVDGVRLDRIEGRVITVGDLAKLVMADDREDNVSLRARALACNLHPDVFAALSAVDGAVLADKLRPFLPAGLVAAEDELAEDISAAGTR